MATAAKKRELDFTDFPPGTVAEYATHLCLACIFDVFTAQLGLAPRTAYSEIKRYAPTIKDLTAPTASRPFFDSDEKNPRCPYCDSAKRWHARLDTYRIEGGKIIFDYDMRPGVVRKSNAIELMRSVGLEI